MTSKIEAPVAWIKFLKGAECKSDGRTYDIMFCEMPGYTPLYATPLSPDHSGGGAGMVLPEPFGWFTDDHMADKSATTYDPVVAERWRAKGWSVTPLYIDKVKELNQ